MPLRRSSFADFVRRLCAAGSASLVWALVIFAASPGLHAELHEADHASRDDACAVALFAAGVSAPVETTATQPPAITVASAVATPTDTVFPASARYLRPPERGPPAGLNNHV